MQPDEKIQAHIVSIWRESKKFLSIGGKEGMLVLTDKHLMFIHKTEAKMKWWKAITQRQVINFIRSKNTMIRHDGYDEEDLMNDVEDKRNTELSFDDISNISFEEKTWGSVLQLEYEKDGKKEKFQYSIAQDWVKYPAKEPTKYMKVDWAPFVQYIKDRQKFTK
ncbi:PH domain protein [Marine Group I thaumarchaeote SCGC AAA799-E16]|uniref:PH domain protein n=2 Tax=Marine Group I TaxID=905826 RepID=A0A087S5I4_9ARCH|nr:PH domain protein [Marine Group I thaumarchaeote SCGC AAA799-E16]KFM20988.1 PH domain protein [Marine Group I thaumarchaeote SCGC RSA3]